MRLQLARWGNSLAVRRPVDYLRAAGLKEGNELEAEFTARGGIRLTPAQAFDKAAFLERLGRLHARLPLQSEDAGELVRRMRDGDRY
jgi:antitoxin MazE